MQNDTPKQLILVIMMLERHDQIEYSHLGYSMIFIAAYFVVYEQVRSQRALFHQPCM